MGRLLSSRPAVCLRRASQAGQPVSKRSSRREADRFGAVQAAGLIQEQDFDAGRIQRIRVLEIHGGVVRPARVIPILHGQIQAAAAR